MLFSLAGLTQLHAFLRWYHGGQIPDPRAFLVLGCLLLLPLGLVALANAVRGLPRLTVGPQGVVFRHAFGTKWADWDSIEPFIVKTIVANRGRQIKTATATITGPNASIKPSKRITIPNNFDEPIEEIAADINAVRASSLGITHVLGSPAAQVDETPVGLSGFFVPWVTFALLALLIGVFVLENSFPVTPAVKHTPSLQTLLAMGALSHAAILSNGEWYRLFTAPLLHGNFAHLAGNGVALVLGGWLLERLVGRLWFFVFFAFSALAGSLASLALEPANLISVGASGGLMGMFAGLFVSSFRIGSGNSSRVRLQFNSLRILIPSLLPSLSHSSGIHIDYGAHSGGALAGAVLALFLLRRLWPETSSLPQARRAATIIAAAGFVLFAGSASIALARYSEYKTALGSRSNPAAEANAGTDGPTAHLQGNDPTKAQSHGSPVKCSGPFFPGGRGAIPGINCSN